MAKNNMGDGRADPRQTLQPRGKSLIGLFGRPCTRWSGRGSKGRWRRRTAFSAVLALSKQVAGPESASRLVRSKCGSRGACACPARQAFPWVFDAAQAEEAPRGTTEPPSLAASVWPEERTHGLRGLSQSLASRRRATQRCRPARRLRALDLHRTWKPEARELKSIFTEPTANDSESTRRARETSNHLVRPPNLVLTLPRGYGSGSVAEISITRRRWLTNKSKTTDAAFGGGGARPRKIGEQKQEQRATVAAHLVRVQRVGAAMQALNFIGLLTDGGVVPGQAESTLQAALRSKFPVQALRPAPARQPAAYPTLTFTTDDVKSVDGAFGKHMPKLKAAGLDGWRLEHIAYLVLSSDRAAC